MPNCKGMVGTELYEYLAKRGYKYNPKNGTFSDFIKKLNINCVHYNDSTRYEKREVDLKLSKFKEK